MKLCPVLLLLLIEGSASAPGGLCPLLEAAAGVASSDKTGCYVVVLRKDSNHSVFETVKTKALELSKDSRLHGTVEVIAKAITVPLNDSSLNIIRSIPEVEYVEEETIARGAQENVPWHLDRLDQGALPLNQRYLPVADGRGVDIYILDSGINFAHEEFENRAKYSGYDPMDVFLRERRQGADCHGHGTHVASLAAGKTYGAAKGARVYSVRVLDCDNTAPWSVVLQGLDHVSTVVAQRGRPAVINLSLGGPYFSTINDAMQNLHSRGIFSVSAAGNLFNNTCTRSPASSSYTFTVGGSRNNDGIYTHTNFGQCVDIFAPGQGIRGANYLCRTCSEVSSGTSMAAPLVGGVAAIHLSMEPLLSPTALSNKLLNSAVRNALDFRAIPTPFRFQTPNLLLNVLGQCGGRFTTPVVLTSPNYPQNYPHNLFSSPCQWTITSAIPGRNVQCNFTDFITELNYDTVTVCEGEFCCGSSEIDSLSGTYGSLLSFTSTGSNMTVQMTTDGIVNLRGFSMSCAASSSGSPTVTPPTVPPTPPTAPPTTDPPLSPTASPTPPTDIGPILINNETRVGEELAHQIPLIISDVLEEASEIMQELVVQSFSGLLQSRVLGQLEEYPAISCQQLASSFHDSPLKSGFYWLRSGNGSSVNVYCDLMANFVDVGPRGFMQVANLNMSEPTQACPGSLKETNDDTHGHKLCGRGQATPGCTSVFFPTHGIPYSKVCGSVIGYQVSSPNAFFAHQYDPTITIDDAYVDGVSLTYGAHPRKHVWSFAAALDEVSMDHSTCPCINTDHTLPETAIPSFVNRNYFCDTSHGDESDALWDGNGCGSRNTCCEGQDFSPWFCTELEETVYDDLEMRLCGNEATSNEDTPLELVRLYIQ